MIEREQQKRRAVELRAGGRSGVRIAARIGIALRTLRRWTVSDAGFRVSYQGVYRLWKAGDDQGIRVLLAGYHPERLSSGTRPGQSVNRGGSSRIPLERASVRLPDLGSLGAIREAREG